MDDLTKAKELLESHPEYTCALCFNGERAVSRGRGISPILALLQAGAQCERACVADTVVGRAAALLYALLGVKGVYARTAERGAKEIFIEQGIQIVYGECVENIINRKGTGLCPMNIAVKDITSPKRAYEVLKEAYTGERAEWERV